MHLEDMRNVVQSHAASAVSHVCCNRCRLAATAVAVLSLVWFVNLTEGTAALVHTFSRQLMTVEQQKGKSETVLLGPASKEGTDAMPGRN